MSRAVATAQPDSQFMPIAVALLAANKSLTAPNEHGAVPARPIWWTPVAGGVALAAPGRTPTGPRDGSGAKKGCVGRVPSASWTASARAIDLKLVARREDGVTISRKPPLDSSRTASSRSIAAFQPVPVWMVAPAPDGCEGSGLGSSTRAALHDIYYLQTDSNQVQPASGSQQPAPKVHLVKLGSELHAPENAMYIEPQQLLFWENIKNDGQVVKGIKAQP
jgi:hypothetical protein